METKIALNVASVNIGKVQQDIQHYTPQIGKCFVLRIMALKVSDIRASQNLNDVHPVKFATILLKANCHKNNIEEKVLFENYIGKCVVTNPEVYSTALPIDLENNWTKVKFLVKNDKAITIGFAAANARDKKVSTFIDPKIIKAANQGIDTLGEIVIPSMDSLVYATRVEILDTISILAFCNSNEFDQLAAMTELDNMIAEEHKAKQLANNII